MRLGQNIIISNDALCRRLYSDIKGGTLAHAYIIEGRPGSGRHTLAKTIVSALACKSESSLPCGKCLSCRHVFEDKCPDVITVGRDGKASVGIDSIRTIKSTLAAVPNDLDVKAYIVEDADTMTVQAQNALLLTLEEPPKNVYFFILCENARALLETIRSRAATLRMDRLSADEIADCLTSDKVDKSISDAAISLKKGQPDEFDTVLVAADGSLGRAMALLSPKERAPVKALRDMAESFISVLMPGSTALPLTMLPEFSSKRDELALQLDHIKCALRDLILLKKTENAPLCFYVSRSKALEVSDRFSEKRLLTAFERVDAAESAIRRNAGVRLTLIDMLSEL